MFAKTIIDSDAFLDMPLSAQALYFHLGMRADDEGFVNNPKKIQRMIGASDDDLKILAAKKFIIPFDSGVIVIKHWKIHNYIPKDRFHKTVYKEEKALLTVKENGAYKLNTDCIQDVYKSETEVRLGKDSIGNIYASNTDTKGYTDEQIEALNSISTAVDEICQNQIRELENNILDTILLEWNRQNVTRKIGQSIRPMTQRYDAIRILLSTYSYEQFIGTIRSLDQQEWLVKRLKERNIHVDFDNFLKPENFKNYFEQKYKDVFKEEKKPTGNKFNNFEQREQDWDTLEEQLFNQGGGV